MIHTCTTHTQIYVYIYRYIYYIYTNRQTLYTFTYRHLVNFFRKGFLHVFATFDPPLNGGRHVPAGSANEPDFESKPSGWLGESRACVNGVDPEITILNHVNVIQCDSIWKMMSNHWLLGYSDTLFSDSGLIYSHPMSDPSDPCMNFWVCDELGEWTGGWAASALRRI